MASLAEFPLDVQFAHAVSLFNRTANSWPALEQLTALSAVGSTSADVDVPPVGEASGENQQQHDPRNRGAVAHAALKSVREHSNDVGLISSNDELDEIATPQLKYLLLPYLCAAAEEDIHGDGDRHERIVHLRNAQDNLQEFFHSLDRLSLLSASDRQYALLDCDNDVHVDDDIDAHRRTRRHAQQQQQGLHTRSETREQKIARFRAEKEAERKLNVLLQRARDEQARGLQRDGQDGGGGKGAENNGGVADVDADEDVQREVSMIVLESGVRRALDLHSSLLREMQVLTWAQKQTARGVDPAQEAQRYRAVHRPASHPSLPQGMPQTFRIIGSELDRQRERDAMFRPSHNLPTFSVEQWGEIQVREMQRKQQEQAQSGDIRAKSNANGNDDDGDDDNEEEDHRKKVEARRWDDWKDDHNRGSGNTTR